MLGLILIYFIGKHFYKLAKTHSKKNDWLYAIIGILTYYAGSIIVGGVVLGLVIELLMNQSIDTFSNVGLGLMMMPFGIAAVYGLYYVLKQKWEKAAVVVKDEIQDIGVNFDDDVE